MEERLAYLQVTGQANLLATPDEPFCGIVLIPFDGVTVIHRELEGQESVFEKIGSTAKDVVPDDGSCGTPHR